MLSDNREKENSATLIELGLTKLQAKIYLTLIEIGEASAKEVSTSAKLDRSNVYRVIKELEKLELIEEQIGFPTKFKVVPLEICISLMLKKKNEEYEKMLSNIQKLIQQQAKVSEREGDNEEDYLKLTPSGSETFCRKWENSLKNVKKSVDVIVTERREPQDDPLWDIYEHLLKKGVKVRWIIDRSARNDEEFSLRIKEFQHLFYSPNIAMKISYEKISPCVIIYDDKFTIICLDETECLKNSRHLWTNNRQLVLNFKKHFEMTWEKSIHYPIILTDQILEKRVRKNEFLKFNSDNY